MTSDNTLLQQLATLTEYHKEKCSLYRDYVDALFKSSNGHASLKDLPWLPVRAFKEFSLKSIEDENVFKIMHSSGTGGKPSSIYLDSLTAKQQQSKLIEIFQDAFGKKRFPMLVIDSESTVKDRNRFTARTAAINGFSIFSRGRAFALNDDLSINYKRLFAFLEENKGKPIFLFGFTFLIWKNFVKSLEESGKKLDLSDAFILHGGGWKKLIGESVSPETFKAKIRETTGCTNVRNYYGMIEQTGSIYMECEHGNLHAPSGSDAIIRCTDTFEKLGDHQEGLIQIFSTIQKSYPGHSLLTEDIGSAMAGSNCGCGRAGTILRIKGRLEKAEIRGCSDAVGF